MVLLRFKCQINIDYIFVQRRETGGELSWKQMRADFFFFFNTSGTIISGIVLPFYTFLSKTFTSYIYIYCLCWFKDNNEIKIHFILHLKCMCVRMFMRKWAFLPFSVCQSPGSHSKVTFFYQGEHDTHTPKMFQPCVQPTESAYLKFNTFSLFSSPHLHAVLNWPWLKIMCVSLTFPGSSLERGTLRKHLFSDRLCRIEFCEGKQRERKVAK